MFFQKNSTLSIVVGLLAALLTSACSPTLNWREVTNNEVPYTVLFPAKPASHARPVNLGGLKVTMTMTAAEADDMNFAVASAMIEDEAQRKAALAFMQQAMVQNLRGEIVHQKTVTLQDGSRMTEIHAVGSAANGRRTALFARFAIKNQQVLQVVALGPQETLNTEIAETFLTSFVLH